jgi:hypothetical protein
MTEVIDGTAGSTLSFHQWYIIDPTDNATVDVVVSLTDTSLHNFYCAIVWADASSTISLDDNSSASGTSQNPTITSTQTGTNELVVSGLCSNANAIDTPGTTDCTELEPSDQGGNVFNAAYSIEGSSGDATHQYNLTESEVYGVSSLSFQEAVSNDPPTVALDTADQISFNDTTPTVLFTGTDTDTDDIRYNIQISDNPDSWTGGAVVTTSFTP